MKNTVETIVNAKGKEKLTFLTAYDYSTAKLMDEAKINGLLIGDSLGMVVMGYENTLKVTVDDIIYHTKAVVRGAKNSHITGDMPFMSYQISPEDALANAGRIIKEGGAHSVKLEGGEEVAETVGKIVKAGIPVMGHIGLTPQSVNALGGYKVQGKSVDGAKKLIKDAMALEQAGAFSVVLECVPYHLAKIITEKLTVPTIGIGAGSYVDGQILVYQDMLGLYNKMTPKFVKTYADLGSQMVSAFENYIEEVKKGIFPSEKHSFTIEQTVLDALKEINEPEESF